MSGIDKNYRAVLDAALAEIEKMDNLVDRQALAMAKYSQSYIRRGNLDFSELQKIPPTTIQDETNALAIAISLADVSACKNLLSYYDVNSINDPDSCVWGYRERYTFLHLALDPLGHFTECRDHTFYDQLEPKEKEAFQNSLITIINLLVEKGADPNLKFEGIYSNPAMSGGVGRGYGFLPDGLLSVLRGELLLAGADPKALGTYFHPSRLNEQRIMQYVETKFKEAKLVEQLALYKRMHSSVQEKVKPIIEASLKIVTELAQLAGIAIKPEPSSLHRPSFF